MTDYFISNSSKLNIESSKVRSCQKGAYYATLSHFTRSHDPCIIGLPTGSGKTALMMALCYGLKIKRVLIIEPGIILREQTFEKFSTLKDLKEINAIAHDAAPPRVRNNEHEFQDEGNWGECRDFDAVVSTTKTTSPEEKNIAKIPEGLFDLLIIDECHHSSAKTWKAIIDCFLSYKTKIVLLSGTPYRRDKIELKGNLIYDYPIELAIQDKIFAPVSFIDAGKPGQNRDQKLIKIAVQTWKEDCKLCKKKPLLLIKTDTIHHANELLKLYNAANINVKVIHSKQDKITNENVIRELRKKEIDGIIAVSMAGEGLDVPSLKIAVFHRNPQSLPYTIQLIGRLARTDTDLKIGKVIGFTDDFSRETFKLYESSPNWLKLIPEIEQKLISGRVGVNHDEELGENQDFVFDSDIFIYHTISVYTFKTTPFFPELFRMQEWSYQGRKIHSKVLRASIFENDLIIIITKTEMYPDWLRSSGFSRIKEAKYDIFLYYINQDVVLEYSKNKEIGSKIKETLFKNFLIPINANKLNNVLDPGCGSYLVVGLKKSGAFSMGVPNYKILLGNEAQNTISNSDNKSFRAGHCLMKMDSNSRESKIRGIAYKHRKIWQLSRENLKTFHDWCKLITVSIQDIHEGRLPGLERLRKTEICTSFTAKPLVLMPNDELLTKSIIFKDEDGIEIIKGFPEIKIIENTLNKIVCEYLQLKVGFSVAITDDSYLHWEISSKNNITISVDPVDGRLKNYSLNGFLNNFPPTIVFEDGSTISDNLYSKPNQSPVLDKSILIPTVWDCNIYSEVKSTRGQLSVQDFLQKKYFKEFYPNEIIIKDHSQFELADFISINTATSKVTFFHVKSAKIVKGIKQKPGRRKTDIEEVFCQCISSSIWIKNGELAKEIYKRLKNRNATKIIFGTIKDIKSFQKVYNPALWNFEIIAAQPAIKHTEIFNSKAIIDLIASTHDYISSAGSTFKFLCFNS